MSPDHGNVIPLPTPWRPLSAIPTDDERERAAQLDEEALQIAAFLLRWATGGDDAATRLARTAAALRAVHGSGGLSVALADARRAAIHELRAQGVPWPTIARTLGVSVTRARQIAHPPGTTTNTDTTDESE